MFGMGTGGALPLCVTGMRPRWGWPRGSAGHRAVVCASGGGALIGKARVLHGDVEIEVKPHGPISTGQLNALLRLHLPPINQVVFLGPLGGG